MVRAPDTPKVVTAGTPPGGSGRKIILCIGPPDKDERVMTMREASDFLLSLM